MIDWHHIEANFTSDSLHPRTARDLDEQVKRAYPATRNLLLIHGNELLLSRCYDRKHTLRQISPIYSVTKSIVSCLIGIALDRGKIKSTDQTLAQLLPTSKACLAGAAAGELTLHQILSMTGGMRWQTGASGNEPMHVRFMRSANWVESIASNPIIDKDRHSFQYNTGLSHLLSAILSASTGVSAAQFASQTLFKLLAIDDYIWPADPQGVSYGGWGLELSCVDMAKIGMLYATDGLYGEQRVLSAEWVATSTRAQTPAYGYHWWLYDFNGRFAFCAEGLSGHTLAIVPDGKVVMALTSAKPGRSRKQIDLLRDHVHRAVDRGQNW